MAKAIFGAGCFWGIEAAFQKMHGVTATAVGYGGGTLADPTYADVCTGQTGHAEVVEVEFDPSRVRFEQLLDVFWGCHNPTTRNRQGPDVGSQYRSAVFVADEEERKIVAEVLKKEGEKKGREIQTKIEDSGPWWRAEEYHQKYLEKNG